MMCNPPYYIHRFFKEGMQKDLRIPTLFELDAFPFYCGALDEFVGANGQWHF